MFQGYTTPKYPYQSPSGIRLLRARRCTTRGYDFALKSRHSSHSYTHTSVCISVHGSSLLRPCQANVYLTHFLFSYQCSFSSPVILFTSPSPSSLTSLSHMFSSTWDIHGARCANTIFTPASTSCPELSTMYPPRKKQRQAWFPIMLDSGRAAFSPNNPNCWPSPTPIEIHTSKIFLKWPETTPSRLKFPPCDNTRSIILTESLARSAEQDPISPDSMDMIGLNHNFLCSIFIKLGLS